MYRISGTTITLTRGDSFYCKVDIQQDGEAYTPAAGDVIRFVVKHPAINGGEYVDTEPLVEKILDNESLVLHLLPADTKDLPFGRYVYDLELTFAGGDVDTFINNAILQLVPEVD